MPEEVEGIFRRRLLIEELPAPQVREQGSQSSRLIPNGRQKGQPEFPAEDRSCLQEPLVVLREPVDPGHEDSLEGIRNGDVRTLQQSLGQLLQEERISL